MGIYFPPPFFAIFKDLKNLNLLVLDLGGRACLAAEVVQADRDRSRSRVAPIPSSRLLAPSSAACRGLCHRPEDHQLAGHAEKLLAAAHLEQLRDSGKKGTYIIFLILFRHSHSATQESFEITSQEPRKFFSSLVFLKKFSIFSQ